MLFANASGHTILCQNSQNRWVITVGLISITFTSYHYHKGQCSEVLGLLRQRFIWEVKRSMMITTQLVRLTLSTSLIRKLPLIITAFNFNWQERESSPVCLLPLHFHPFTITHLHFARVVSEF